MGQWVLKFVWFSLVYWSITPQQQPGQYQDGDYDDEMSVSMVEETIVYLHLGSGRPNNLFAPVGILLINTIHTENETTAR